MGVSDTEYEYAKAKVELNRLDLKLANAIRDKVESLKPITPEEGRFLANYNQKAILHALEQIRQELAAINIRSGRLG